jgi:hypothetical protein
MPRKGWLTLVAFLVIFFGILCGGPKLSAYIFRKYKEKIDKNGAIVKAQVYLKKTHKGNTIHFEYLFEDEVYRNHEQNDPLFEKVNIGDSIMVLVDSTKPSNSYIVSIGNY